MSSVNDIIPWSQEIMLFLFWQVESLLRINTALTNENKVYILLQ